MLHPRKGLSSMRSMWKGAISFGLVNIPIQLFTATEEKSVRFNQLHRICSTPIKYVKFCPTCNAEVAQSDIVRGFAYDPGRYVLIDESDLESLPLPSLRSIDILNFVNLNEIDPLFFFKTYYVEPQERADKAYGLLRRAMLETGKIAVAKVTLRQKESLATVRVYGQLLLLHLMFFPDEVRNPGQLRGGTQAPESSEMELRIAEQLVESLSVPFNPEAYQDEYRTALLQRIEAKAAGERDVIRPEQPGAERVDDLMAALEASLRAAQSDQKKAAQREPQLVR